MFCTQNTTRYEFRNNFHGVVRIRKSSGIELWLSGLFPQKFPIPRKEDLERRRVPSLF